MQRTPFDIPDQMRDAADRTLDQAKKAVGQFMDATQQAVAKAEGSDNAVRGGAGDVQRQAMAYVEENIAAAFDFAGRLVHAAAEQGKTLGAMMGRTAAGARKEDK